MTGKIFLRLLTVPAIAGSMLAMGLLSLANGGVSPRLYAGTAALSEAVSEAASCGVPEYGSALRSLHGDTLVASTVDMPLLTDSQTEPAHFDFNFSDAESDAAVALFGCDCPACLNALQQLRNQPPVPQVLTSRRLGPSTTAPTTATAANRARFASRQRGVPVPFFKAAAPSVGQTDVADPVQGHCWVNLQERSTPADIQAVLQTLEAEEAKAARGG
jgi:hypothetical protein